MNKRAIRALYDDLPDLVRRGVLTDDAAERLRAHYGEVKEVSRTSIALVIFSILGASLIGAGIILLIAHNWENMGHGARTVLSFAPLVVAQGIGAWTLAFRPRSVAWREGSAILITAGVGAAISLIAQTYHISGDEARFFFTWSVLTLPLIYLFRSTTVVFLYMALVLTWAGLAQNLSGHSAAFWLLTAALAPYGYAAARENIHGARANLLARAIVIYLTIGIGITLEKTLPGLWTIIYSALFAAFVLAGRQWPSQGFRNPFQWFGAAGALVLLLMFTYGWPWENAGLGHYRRGAQYVGWASLQDYVLVIAMPALALWLAYRESRREPLGGLLWGAFPLLTVVSFALVSFDLPAELPMILFNLYMALLGIGLLAAGIQSRTLVMANYGVLVLTALACARFFDADLGFVLRGVIFIVVGVLFLVTNVVLVRRLGGREAAA